MTILTVVTVVTSLYFVINFFGIFCLVFEIVTNSETQILSKLKIKILTQLQNSGLFGIGPIIRNAHKHCELLFQVQIQPTTNCLGFAAFNVFLGRTYTGYLTTTLFITQSKLHINYFWL